ncbi:site-specific integrase [Solitalea koreensis]|uniref:Site-specific recombinase XerD n=1 Tax=Solitalea koreensis TaxID=543615 RepID=A0A521DKS3_9SPHI|nr:site-specific integrase [Solitalea koreensis]SMO72309.1 Site-specific recombinase XerD [Solitalea koreensis]
MASVKFYVEKRKDKNGILIVKNVPILLSFSFDGLRLNVYTGERIDTDKWDANKQKVKRSVNSALQINSYLESLSNEVEKIYRDARIIGDIPTVNYIKSKLSKNQKLTNKTFFEVFEEYIESHKNQCTLGTIKKYKTNLVHLKKFSLKKKYPLEFETLDEGFLKKYIEFFITDLQHTNNTIAKNIRILKGFLNWAIEQNYSKNQEFKKFKYKENDGEIIALDWDELMHLYDLKLESKSLEHVRDVFCFGCFTGLRFSDIYNLRRENIVNDTITLTTIKTKELTMIPLNDYSREILNRYVDYPMEKCLPVISNQKMNDYLKEVGKIAGIDKPITIIRFRGAQRLEKKCKKYEVLTSHVARKTFVTNAYRQGIPTEIIMSITGHKSPEILARYNHIAEEQKREAMKKAFTKF